ncbi:MAG: peptidoglycan recognition protein family protein, partial [Thermomicrobiales bacterium]
MLAASHEINDGDRTPDTGRGWTASRRVMLKASALLGGLAALRGVGPGGDGDASAANTGSTRAERWAEGDHDAGFRAADAGGFRTVSVGFTWYAVGGSWLPAGGTAASVELSTSADGVSFSAPVMTTPAVEDGGRPNRGGRVFLKLVFSDGATTIRYRTLDGGGAPVKLPGFELVFIDASGGPRAANSISAAGLPALGKPDVVSRSGLGADESLRFTSYGEIWVPEYQFVEHVIIHHTATLNTTDPYLEMRSIYQYHAVEQGWGDIGYNYLVDRQGRVFEGRFGGDNVVGGHAFQYAYGSSGIGTLGTFSAVDVTDSCRAAIVAITAWCGRNLDPAAKTDFHETRLLPTVAGHRDVNESECPGDVLWSDLPGIRTAVAQLLAQTNHPPDSGVPANPFRFKTPDNVIIRGTTYLRVAPSSSARAIRKLTVGAATPVIFAAIVGKPAVVAGVEWYFVHFEDDSEGFVLGSKLAPAPPGSPPDPIFEVGDKVSVLVAALPLRRSPGSGQNAPFELARGDAAQVSAASVAATGFRWFGVASPTHATGWVKQETIGLAQPRTLSLSFTSSIVGKSNYATVAGFPVNRSVTIQWDGVPITTPLPFTTGDDGGGTIRFFPPSSPVGPHTVSAVVGIAQARRALSITPRIRLIPVTGAVGATIAAQITGFGAAETVTVQWPLNGGFTTLASPTTDANGAVNTSIVIPAGASGTT